MNWSFSICQLNGYRPNCCGQWINRSLTNLTINTLSEINDYNYWTGSVQLPALNRVDIKNSRIDTIENNSLQGLSKCTHLIFNNCSIKCISAGSFETISSTLISIDLRNNLLTTLSSDLFTEYLCKSLMIIYISENPWDCCILSANFIESVNENSDIFDGTIWTAISTLETTQASNASSTVSASTTTENYPMTTTKFVSITKASNSGIQFVTEIGNYLLMYTCTVYFVYTLIYLFWVL